MQIVKQIDFLGSFTGLHEIKFNFENLEDELREHESFSGIDNFVKYFVKVEMNYQGGSLLAGNELEVLHEFTVKNHLNK